MKDITIHQLRIFEAIARRKNFTRAAEEFYLSQPTVSAQMKQLTKNIGMPVIEQIGKRIYVTDAGKELYQTCTSIFDELSRLESAIADMSGVKKGNLRIATTTTTINFMPRFLGPFCHRYPGIDVSMEVLNRERVLYRLSENMDDLYILGQPPQNVDVEFKPFLANPLVVVAYRGHPLAGQSGISLQRLAEEPFIMREAGSGTRMAVERLVEERDVPIRVRMELGSNEAIKQAVEAELGISVLSEHSIDTEGADENLAILDVEGFPIERYWYVAYPTGKQLSVIAKAFLEHLIKEGEQLGSRSGSGTTPDSLGALAKGASSY